MGLGLSGYEMNPIRYKQAEEAMHSAQIRRTNYVMDRVLKILSDKDYASDLVLTLIDLEGGSKVLEAATADFGQLANKVASLHAALTRAARHIAESEADIRWQRGWFHE